MNCKCGRPVLERKVATKTQTIGGDLIVMVSRDALCCDSCGVIAWGTFPRRVASPFPQSTPWQPLLTPVVGPRIPTPPWPGRQPMIC